MILKLPFKKAFYYTEKPIEIILRIGSLEDLCDELGLKFWQVKDYMQKNDIDFSVNLLWHGYLTACEKRGIRKKYNKKHAAMWYEYMTVSEKQKFVSEIKVLFGKIIESYSPDKKKVQKKQSGVS